MVSTVHPPLALRLLTIVRMTRGDLVRIDDGDRAGFWRLGPWRLAAGIDVVPAGFAVRQAVKRMSFDVFEDGLPRTVGIPC